MTLIWHQPISRMKIEPEKLQSLWRGPGLLTATSTMKKKVTQKCMRWCKKKNDLKSDHRGEDRKCFSSLQNIVAKKLVEFNDNQNRIYITCQIFKIAKPSIIPISSTQEKEEANTNKTKFQQTNFKPTRYSTGKSITDATQQKATPIPYLVSRSSNKIQDNG